MTQWFQCYLLKQLQWMHQYLTPSASISTGLLLIRGFIGIAFMYHAWGKLSKGATLWMGDMLPAWLQALAAYGEGLGGMALVLGVLHPIACMTLLGAMMGAMLLVHLPAHHPFIAVGTESSETALMYLMSAIGLAFTGPGRWSLDTYWVQILRKACTSTHPEGI
ncbi:MAG: DoxX family protein [Vampirovibrionales bacterium]